jgi:hypothetical protein
MEDIIRQSIQEEKNRRKIIEKSFDICFW